MSSPSSAPLSKIDVALVLAIALGAVALFILSTPWGIGIRPDSAYYLRFPIFLQGNSPAYVWAIQFVAAFGLDDIAAATVLNSTFLTLNVIIVYALVRGFGATRTIAALAAILVLSSPLVFELHVTVLSEAMFIFLLLVALSLLSFYAGSGKLVYLTVAGVVSVLLFLTRFNGAPVMVVGLLTVLFLGHKAPRIRLFHLLTYLASLFIPMAMWAALEAGTGGTGLGRDFGLFGNPTLATLLQGANSIWVSFFPSLVPISVKVLTAVILIVLLCAVFWHQTSLHVGPTEDEDHSGCATFPLIAVVYIFGHFALLLVSLIIEAHLPLKPSYFAPVYVLVVIIGAQYTTMLRNADGTGRQVFRGSYCCLGRSF